MPRVGRAAYALGFAGLLPPCAAMGFTALGHVEAALFGFFYAAAILSFLGGIWWGLAMRRAGGQGRLAALAVLPSLAAVALLVAAFAGILVASWSDDWATWSMVLLGVAVILTLPVDRYLVRTGEAPAGWMRLRIPLSLGLGGLTIVSAVLASRL